jgi:hypothetical protein
MIQLSSNEDFSASSGIINMPALEAVYHSIIDETFVDLGRTITLHLNPIIEQDVPTQGLQPPQQYNPFFGGVPVPNNNTKGKGVKVTPRDVDYKAHIVVGPLKEGDDSTGMGDLKANEAMVTLVIESLPHVKDTLSVSIEGRRYSIIETRPIGFTVRRYLMVKLEEINEQDIAGGVNEG